jgi:uncharacterized protein (DUF1697 family)
MAVMVALLRAVNLGGRNQIRMAALEALCRSVGFETPKTLIQSGNVVFRIKRRNLGAVALQLEQEIERSHGFRPAVILRTLAEMRDIAARNPFSGRSGIDPAKLMVTFLRDRPAPSAAQAALARKTEPEELWLDGREMFIYFPLGMGRSRLPMLQIEKLLAIPATTRNWNTVLRLIAAAEQIAGE